MRKSGIHRNPCNKTKQRWAFEQRYFLNRNVEGCILVCNKEISFLSVIFIVAHFKSSDALIGRHFMISLSFVHAVYCLLFAVVILFSSVSI